MGLPLVTLLLALGPVALLVGHGLLANRTTLLAAELTAATDIALLAFLAAPVLALGVHARLQPSRLAAALLPAVLLATPRVGLLDLLAAPLLSAPVLAALRLGPPALPQPVPVSAGLRLARAQLALHAPLLAAVLRAALRDVAVLLLAALLGRYPFQASLGAAASPCMLPSASLAVLLSSLLASFSSPSPALLADAITILLAGALLALPLTALPPPPLAALPFVRFPALSSTLTGIVLVGRLATPLSVPLPRGLELPTTLGAPSPSLSMALELGLPTLLGLSGVLAVAFPVLATAVLVASSATLVPFSLSATVLGAPVSVAHGSWSPDRHPAVDGCRELPKSSGDDPVGTSAVPRLNGSNRSRSRRSNGRVTMAKGRVTPSTGRRSGTANASAGRATDHDTAGTISSSQSRKNASVASGSGFTWWSET